MKVLMFLVLASLTINNVMADTGNSLAGSVSDPFVEAQEKLIHAKGSYKTIKQQESAIENMRKATRLSLKAAKLRATAEKLQNKADMLVNKANQQALSRGLYITNPLGGIKMDSPPVAKAPVPGQAINIVLPKQEEVSYEQNNGSEPPIPATSLSQ